MLVVVGVGVLIYLLGISRQPYGPGEDVFSRPGFYHGGGGPMQPGGFIPTAPKTGFESNGELIYYTGYNESGKLIDIEYGPGWLYMHGGSCVNCHGPDGKGGFPVMMGTAIPPDIRYEVLTSEGHGENGDGHDEEGHPPYTDDTIKRAIREGLDPAGDPLDFTMPRWRMSDRNLDDLVEYLKTF